MVYDPVQERRDELRELEPRAPTVDPWELLRELLESIRVASNGGWSAQSMVTHGLCYDANAALKQHGAERESDGT